MNKKIIAISILTIFLIGSLCVSGNNISKKSNLDRCPCENSHSKVSYDPNNKHSRLSLGLLESDVELKESEFDTVSSAPPDSWDWRNKDGKDYTTSVKDQGGCGSCYAFGVIGALEGAYKVQKNKPNANIDLSEQFMVSCGYSCYHGSIYDGQVMNGCGGATFDLSVDFISRHGAIPEEKFNYDSGEGEFPSCSSQDKADSWRNNLIKANWGKVGGDFDNKKDKLVSYGPLVTRMSVYEDFCGRTEDGESFSPSYPNENVWRDNVYYQKEGGSLGSHMVVIVGYKDDESYPGGGYWICKNSWSADWGLDGFFKIAYGECGIDRTVAYFMNIQDNGDYDKPAVDLVGSYIGPIEGIYYMQLNGDTDDSQVSKTFEISNAGNYGSKLDWEITEGYSFDFYPKEGYDLERGEIVSVRVTYDVDGEEEDEEIITIKSKGDDGCLDQRKLGIRVKIEKSKNRVNLFNFRFLEKIPFFQNLLLLY